MAEFVVRISRPADLTGATATLRRLTNIHDQVRRIVSRILPSFTYGAIGTSPVDEPHTQSGISALDIPTLGEVRQQFVQALAHAAVADAIDANTLEGHRIHTAVADHETPSEMDGTPNLNGASGFDIGTPSAQTHARVSAETSASAAPASAPTAGDALAGTSAALPTAAAGLAPALTGSRPTGMALSPSGVVRSPAAAANAPGASAGSHGGSPAASSPDTLDATLLGKFSDLGSKLEAIDTNLRNLQSRQANQA